MMAAGGRQLVCQRDTDDRRRRAGAFVHELAASMCIKLSILYIPPPQQKNLLVLRTSAVQPEQRGELL